MDQNMENNQGLQQGGADQGNQQQNSQGNNKTFTQEEVNKIVQDRLARERGKGGDPSAAEKALEEREKALAAREAAEAARAQEATFKAAMKAKEIPEEVYEALNCTSEDTFNKALEILSPYFKKLTEPIMNAVGATNNVVGGDAIREAMGLK